MEVNRKANISAYVSGDLTIDVSDFRVQRNGETQKMTPRAFEVLIYLIENRGRVVEKQELFEQIWRESFVTDNALTRIIKEIRHVIGDDAGNPRFIETVPKRGYRFIAEALEIENEKSVVAPAVSSEQIISAENETLSNPPEIEKTNAAAIAKPAQSKFWFVIIPVLILIPAVLSVWFFSGRQPLNTATAVVRTVQITNWSGLDNYPAISPDGNSVAYASDHNGSFEIYVKPLASGAREIQVTSEAAQNFQPAWSPDGQRIAFHSRARGGIWTIPAAGGAAQQLTDFGSRPAWSPDGKLIAFQSGALTDLGANVRTISPSALWLVSSEGGNPKQLTQTGNPIGGHGSPAWSPDGKNIAFNAEGISSFNIWTIEIKTGDLRKVIENSFDPVYAPDGQSIYYSTLNGISNIGMTAANPSQVVNSQALPIRHLSISASGKRIVYSMLRSQSSIWSIALDAKTGNPTAPATPLIQNTAARNTFPTFSPNGRQIAFVSYQPGAFGELWLMSPDGKNQTPTTINAIFPNWFPDGDQIASLLPVEDKIKFSAFNLATRKETILLVLDEAEYARLSPDGREVVFHSKKNGVINIWLARIADKSQKQLTFDNELMGFPAWSPDGKFIGFQVKRGDDTHIAVMTRDGGQIEQLTNQPGQSWINSFAPDGERIVFSGQRDYIWNVYWISRATREQKQLTNNTKLNAYVRYPAWSPLGNQIAYEYAETTGNIWMTELK